MTILIAGATGAIGRHVVEQLTEAGRPVRALSCNPAAADLPHSVEVVAGDLTDPGTLTAAFDGVTAVHLITFGGDNGEPLSTGPQLVQLATRAGVRRVTVLCGWDESTLEPALRASDLGWTLLVPVEFTSGALEWAGSVREHGAVRLLADWPRAVVHDADIAAVAATALTEDGHAGCTYPISGPQALTPAGANAPDWRGHWTRCRLRASHRGPGAGPAALVRLFGGLRRVRHPVGHHPAPANGRHPPDRRGRHRPTGRAFAQWATENADSFRRP